MSTKRKTYSAEFKAKLVLEVLEGDKTVNEIASTYEIIPKNLINWKQQFLENMSLAFDKSAVVKEHKDQIETLQKSNDDLAKKVGNLTIEKDFLEGKLVSLASSKERKVLVDAKHDLSLNKQCKLLHVSKSSLYYQPMKPFGTGSEIKLYEYLLKEFRDYAGRVVIEKHNQVWSTDITYIKLERGFVYLAAIIDWHSKKILSWKLSNTMDLSLTTSVLKEALALYPKPEIFNSDQGSQYTSKEHTGILKKHDIKISMDGVGRATDNICIERFWRTIKYEEIYLNEYKNIKELQKAITKFMASYNKKRLHSSLGYKTPNEVYYEATNNLDSKGEKLLPLVS